LLNEISNRYECINRKCNDTFLKIIIEKHYKQLENDKGQVPDNAIAWFGNQYFDSKRGKWRDGKKPKKIRFRNYTWLWYIVLFIFLILLINIIINQFHPGTKVFFFFW